MRIALYAHARLRKPPEIVSYRTQYNIIIMTITTDNDKFVDRITLGSQEKKKKKKTGITEGRSE